MSPFRTDREGLRASERGNSEVALSCKTAISQRGLRGQCWNYETAETPPDPFSRLRNEKSVAARERPQSIRPPKGWDARCSGDPRPGDKHQPERPIQSGLHTQRLASLLSPLISLRLGGYAPHLDAARSNCCSMIGFSIGHCDSGIKNISLKYQCVVNLFRDKKLTTRSG